MVARKTGKNRTLVECSVAYLPNCGIDIHIGHSYTAEHIVYDFGHLRADVQTCLEIRLIIFEVGEDTLLPSVCRRGVAVIINLNDITTTVDIAQWRVGEGTILIVNRSLSVTDGKWGVAILDTQLLHSRTAVESIIANTLHRSRNFD